MSTYFLLGRKLLGLLFLFLPLLSYADGARLPISDDFFKERDIKRRNKRANNKKGRQIKDR